MKTDKTKKTTEATQNTAAPKTAKPEVKVKTSIRAGAYHNNG